jgi:hypothetical protein
MAPYSDQVDETCEAMSYIIKREDHSDMVIHSTNSDDHCRIRGTKEPLRIRQRQLLQGLRDNRHPIYKVLQDYRNSRAFSRKKIRPLNICILTAGEHFDLYNLSHEQLTDLDLYCRRELNMEKTRLMIRFIIFGSYSNSLDRWKNKTLYLRDGNSITYGLVSFPSKVLP